MRARLAGWAALLFIAPAPAADVVRITSKSDTETTVLAHIVAQLVANAGESVFLKERLGGTRVVWDALLANDYDVYPEYTGTISEQLLSGKNIRGEAALREELARLGLGMTRPLGFVNNYALGMRRARAAELGITTISDLKRHPNLVLGFSNEFVSREDGWRGLKPRYALPQSDVRGMDHRVAYEALAK